jgi:hypothetical protein
MPGNPAVTPPENLNLEMTYYRLFTLLRAALWRKIDLWELLRFCGTPGGHCRYLATPQHAYFPGFA